MWQLISESAKPRFFRPHERAIVLIVVVTIGALTASLLDPSFYAEQHWLNVVFEIICFGIIGLASALTSLWRVLVALLVVTPLNYYAADIIRGAPNAWDPQNLPLELLWNTLYNMDVALS